MSFWCARAETEYDHDSERCSVCKMVYNTRYEQVMEELREKREAEQWARDNSTTQ